MLKRENGFSLVELLVTVAILGIAMAIAIPQMEGALFRSTYRDSAQDVLQALRQARSLAVARNFEQRVRFDISEGSYILQEGSRASNTPASGWTPIDTDPANWIPLQGTVALRESDECDVTTDITFEFHPNGTAEIIPDVDPVGADQIMKAGSICIMNASDLTEAAKFIISVDDNNDNSLPITSSTGRSFIQ